MPPDTLSRKPVCWRGKFPVACTAAVRWKRRLKGVSDDYDLALLKVEATDLTAAAWRTEPVTPGTLVAAVSPEGMRSASVS